MPNDTVDTKPWSLYHISRFRGVLLGAAALWIAWYHSFMHFGAVPPYEKMTTAIAVLLNTAHNTGNAGVDIFLLMSGVGLYFSYEKTQKLLPFYKKRALRVLPPFLIVSVLWTGIKCDGGFLTFFKRVFLIDFFTEGSRVCWYVNLLVILYLIYPLLHRSLKKWGVRSIMVSIGISVALALALRILTPVFFSRIDLAVLRLPVFICGVWLGKMVYEKREISGMWLAIAAAVFAGCWLWFLYLNYMQEGFPNVFVQFYLYCPFTVSLVLLGSALFARFPMAPVQKLLAWFGGFSFEIYLLFEKVDRLCKPVFHVDDGMHIVYYVPVFFTTILLSIALQQVSKYLTRTLFAPQEPKAGIKK